MDMAGVIIGGGTSRVIAAVAANPARINPMYRVDSDEIAAQVELYGIHNLQDFQNTQNGARINSI